MIKGSKKVLKKFKVKVKAIQSKEKQRKSVAAKKMKKRKK